MSTPNSRKNHVCQSDECAILDNLFEKLLRPVIDDISEPVLVTYRVIDNPGSGYISGEWRMVQLTKRRGAGCLFVDEDGIWHLSVRQDRSGTNGKRFRYYFKSKSGTDPTEILATIPYFRVLGGVVRMLDSCITSSRKVLESLESRRDTAAQMRKEQEELATEAARR